MATLMNAPITNTIPDFTDEQYPGNLYYNEYHNTYIVTFENLYGEDEVNNWLPEQIRNGIYKFVKRDEETFYAYDEVHPLVKIYMKVKGTIPILDNAWKTIPADLVHHYEPEPSPVQPLLQEEMYHPWPTSSASLLARLLLPPSTQPLVNTALSLLSWTQPAVWDEGHLSCQPLYAKPNTSPPQKRIADVMIADAVSKGACCPISMNPLTQTSAACVAPCYHIFEKEAIQTWLTEHTTCPECRQHCSL